MCNVIGRRLEAGCSPQREPATYGNVFFFLTPGLLALTRDVDGVPSFARGDPRTPFPSFPPPPGRRRAVDHSSVFPRKLKTVGNRTNWNRRGDVVGDALGGKWLNVVKDVTLRELCTVAHTPSRIPNLSHTRAHFGNLRQWSWMKMLTPSPSAPPALTSHRGLSVPAV